MANCQKCYTTLYVCQKCGNTGCTKPSCPQQAYHGGVCLRCGSNQKQPTR